MLLPLLWLGTQLQIVPYANTQIGPEFRTQVEDPRVESFVQDVASAATVTVGMPGEASTLIPNELVRN